VIKTLVPQQASNAVGRIGTQVVPHWLVCGPAHVITGGVVSPRTITSKVHVVEFPKLSYAVTVTVFVPTGKGEPDGGL
jgi:hypothetical protein